MRNRTHGRTPETTTSWVVVLILGLVLAACGSASTSTTETGSTAAGPTDTSGPAASTTASEENRYGGELVVALVNDEDGYLYGPYPPASAGQYINDALFDTVLTRTSDGELVGNLAESWELSEGNTRLTIKLRPGITFHDGSPLTADAYKTWFDNVMRGEDSRLAAIWAPVEEIAVIDDLTFEFRLSTPLLSIADYLMLYTGSPFSPTAYEGLGPEAAAAAPVGTGPFRFSSWSPGNELILERNPDYWREGLPYLDRIVFRFIPDPAARAAALQSGDVDLVLAEDTLTALEFAGLGEAEGFSAELFRDGAEAIIFNSVVPPTDDLRVRRALTHALDAEALIAARGVADATSNPMQYFDPNSVWFNEDALDDYPALDPEAARTLIEEYVNDPSRSDGKAVGEPISLTFQTFTDTELVNAATLVEQMWEQLGVEVELVPTEAAAFRSAIQGSPEDDFVGTYQVSQWSRVGYGANRDPDGHLPNVHGPVTDPTNWTNFTTDRLQELIQAARGAAYGDVETRKPAYDEIAVILSEEVPEAYVMSRLMGWAWSDRIQGIDDWTSPDGNLGDGIETYGPAWDQLWLSGD